MNAEDPNTEDPNTEDPNTDDEEDDLTIKMEENDPKTDKVLGPRVFNSLDQEIHENNDQEDNDLAETQMLKDPILLNIKIPNVMNYRDELDKLQVSIPNISVTETIETIEPDEKQENESNEVKKRNRFFSKLLQKFTAWITHSSTPGPPPVYNPPSIMDSLINIVISSHSETTVATYEDNYKKKNEYFKKIFTAYDNRILIESGLLTDPNRNPTDLPKNLLSTYKQLLIMAVSQGVCSLAENTVGRSNVFNTRRTRDAKNLLHIYEKSVELRNLIEEGEAKGTAVKNYIQEIKYPLNVIDLQRYTELIIREYHDTIQRIIDYIEYVIKVFIWIGANNKTITPNDPINQSKDKILLILPFFKDLLANIEPINSETDQQTKITNFNQFIIQQKSLSIQWPTSQTNNALVKEDIFNLVLINQIINPLLTNPNITAHTNVLKQFQLIDKKFLDYIFNAAEDGLPLFFRDDNRMLLFYEGILKKSFWRSEDHTLSDYDTQIFLIPNADEGENDFDCSYGLNIFALMLQRQFLLPKGSGKLTRSKYDEKIAIGLSGSQIMEKEDWRDHRLQIPKYKILDEIVDIFKNNWFRALGPFGHSVRLKDGKGNDVFVTNILPPKNAKDARLADFIRYTLKKNIKNIKEKINMLNRALKNGSPDWSVGEDYDRYDSYFRIISPINNLKFINQLKGLNVYKPDPALVFVYCRVLEFTYFLERILVGDPEKYDDVSKNKLNENKSKKVVLLSELIYLFQYLLKFDYAIYVLTSCRGCEEGGVLDPANKIPSDNTTQSIKRPRYGGYKSKRRINKRNTLKRKRNYKRKTLKRKRNNKRKTNKRK